MMRYPKTLATLVAGTLDILAAMILTVHYGGTTPGMLRGIASGPFPAAEHWGAAGAISGLAVHFAIMAVMVFVYFAAAERVTAVNRHPICSGILYGVVTWLVMNALVLPLRFGTPFPPSYIRTAIQLFCHIVLVGLPIALIARKAAKRDVID